MFIVESCYCLLLNLAIVDLQIRGTFFCVLTKCLLNISLEIVYDVNEISMHCETGRDQLLLVFYCNNFQSFTFQMCYIKKVLYFFSAVLGFCDMSYFFLEEI